jgi:hypothetical protein
MIPNKLHYVYIKERPWKLHHYLSVKSAIVKAGITDITIWLDKEPEGEWWDKTKPLVKLIFVDPPSSIFGIDIKEPAHKSDVIRLQVLIQEGGIYADTDVIFVKPFTYLLDNKFVMGQQGEDGIEGLCPATMLAEPNSDFAKYWLTGFKYSFKGGPPGSPTWCTHSVAYPRFLANLHPDLITVINHQAFFWPLYHDLHIKALFEENHTFPNAYSHHLWESSGKKYLEELTVDKIKENKTTFTNIVKDLI